MRYSRDEWDGGRVNKLTDEPLCTLYKMSRCIVVHNFAKRSSTPEMRILQSWYKILGIYYNPRWCTIPSRIRSIENLYWKQVERPPDDIIIIITIIRGV